MYKHPIAFLSVNNLTVARYAAAMMADYVGFCFDSNSDKNITVAKAKEIMGWLSGVKFIGEFYKRPADEIIAIALELNLDKVLVYSNYSDADLASIPFEKIGVVSNPSYKYIMKEDTIYDASGNIFALAFYSDNEDETGVINFDAITEKLEGMEV